jgi:hypothetical protein
MLRSILKGLLATTALAPALVVMAVRGFESNHITATYYCSMIALSLAFICYAVLRWCPKHLERMTLNIKSSKTLDKESIALLIAYLLPLIPWKTEHAAGFTFSQLCVLVIVFIAFAKSTAYYSNPLLMLLGYQVYEVQRSDDITVVLITPYILLRNTQPFEVVQLFDTVFLAVEESPQ